MKLKNYLVPFGLAAVLLSTLSAPLSIAHAQGTAFTYQGVLQDGGAPATGLYDLEFRAFDAVFGGAQQGGTLTPQDVPVTNGLFTVTLDFGGGVFTGPARWLNIAVRPGASVGAYTDMLPRQPLMPAPYAVFAGGTAAAGVTGTLPDARLSANVALRVGGNAFTGNQSVTGGRVGIGTTTPDATLTVANIAGIPNLELLKPSSDIGYQFFVDANGMALCERNVACGRLFVQNGTGNIGIGTATPANTLAVNGTFGIFGPGLDGSTFQRAVVYADSSNGMLFEAPLNASSAKLPYHFNWRGGGADAMTILGNGNVGIGTLNPVAGLDISGSSTSGGFASPARALRVRSTVSFGAAIGVDASTVAGGKEWLFFSTGGDAAEGQGRLVLRNDTDNVNALTATAAGNIGIGTSTPVAGLHVERSGGVSAGSWSYLTKNDFNSGSFAGSPNLAIYTSGNIGAATYYAFSDARIKNVIGVSLGSKDLNTLRSIEVTDYNYKDTVANGNRPVKKVIAQQVESVYPQAVSKTTGVVPDIFKKATQQDGWVKLATDLKAGDRVKLIGENSQGVYEVLETRDGAFRTPFQSGTDQVFVVGREVKDFRNVDYEAISMLNVSATQELARKLDAQESELTDLRAEVSKLRSERTSLTQTVNDMEARFVRLEQAMNKTTVPAVKDVSASADVK